VKIRKAVITAAAPNQRRLPLQNLIDRDGEEKPVLGILIDQILAARIEEICVIVWPGDESRFAEAVRHHGRVRFVAQAAPAGYADAIWQARDFLAGEPFLHLVGDHLYLNTAGKPPAERLLEVAQSEECSVSAVQITREGLLPNFGAVGGRRVSGRQGIYRVDTVLEKPSPTEAELALSMAGIRAGYYLCFFGMHVFTPSLIEILGRRLSQGGEEERSLSSALAELARREQYLAMEEPHRRYNIGARYGLLTAQLALALHGRDREEVLSQLVELLATQEMGAAAEGSRA
jgi:UTP--glucose-1-phosphate uridylyltransferase